MKEYRILIVDDEVDITDSVIDYFDEYTVTGSNNPRIRIRDFFMM